MLHIPSIAIVCTILVLPWIESTTADADQEASVSLGKPAKSPLEASYLIETKPVTLLDQEDQIVEQDFATAEGQ
jgi:hypothetical protein